jgi:hypothetical protein
MTPRQAASELEGLDAPEDLAHQERSWRLQSLGQLLCLLLVLGAMAGLFGGGPLSAGKAQSEDGLARVDYPRIARAHAPFSLEIKLSPGAAVNGQVRLSIPDTALESFHISEISPEPTDARLAGGHLQLSFLADAAPSNTIRLYGEAEKVGRHSLRLTVGEASEVTLTQVIYP